MGREGGVGFKDWRYGYVDVDIGPLDWTTKQLGSEYNSMASYRLLFDL